MENKFKPSSAQVSHFHANKLKQISAHKNQSGNRILEDAIDAIYSGMSPLYQPAMESGDFIDYT